MAVPTSPLEATPRCSPSSNPGREGPMKGTLKLPHDGDATEPPCPPPPCRTSRGPLWWCFVLDPLVGPLMGGVMGQALAFSHRCDRARRLTSLRSLGGQALRLPHAHHQA